MDVPLSLFEVSSWSDEDGRHLFTDKETATTVCALLNKFSDRYEVKAVDAHPDLKSWVLAYTKEEHG